MKWDQGLTGQALQIAQTTNSPVWVAAGPGTGKTFALMRRLARLLEVDRAAPDRILVCTFTRTAAGDLARAVADLGITGTDKVRAQTVHALCFSMLSRQEVLEATGRVPRPLLQCEERFLLEDLSHTGLGSIRVTTQTLTREQIQKLSDEVGEGRSLLVLCGAFRVKNLDAFPNLTVKKIPKAVLSRCEWGKDDYSLEIAHLPMREAASDQQLAVSEGEGSQQQRPETKAQRRASVQQPSLFDLPGGKGSAK
jgi:hypothetical protein